MSLQIFLCVQKAFYILSRPINTCQFMYSWRRHKNPGRVECIEQDFLEYDMLSSIDMTAVNQGRCLQESEHISFACLQGWR